MTRVSTTDFFDQLAQQLVASSILTRDALERASRVAETKGEALDSVLVKLGMVSEQSITNAIVDLTGKELVAQSDYPLQPLLHDKLSRRFLLNARCIPLAIDGESMQVAMANPGDEFIVNSLSMTCQRQIRRCVGVPSEIRAAIDRLYPDTEKTTTTVAPFNREIIDQLMDRASDAPVIQLLNSLMTRAVQNRASDIHFEPTDEFLNIRYRVDGVLTQVQQFPIDIAQTLASRIKLLGNLNIAEKRLPQDGRFQMQIEGKDTDMRISTLPTHYGESIALRILNRDDVRFDVKALGFTADIENQFNSMLGKSHGLILVTGPTGSGKTTTLYASMQKLNLPERKLLSVEDPIEYRLAGIEQIQIHTEIGVSFSQTLRSVLRHDPDVLLIGEIRDAETAQTAIQSALTGHIVLSTLHTYDAGSSISRLLDMGIDDYLLASTLKGVLAQRLVRTLCEQCKKPVPFDGGAKTLLDNAAIPYDRDSIVYQAVGCGHCNGIGYFGRTIIAEFLEVDDSIRGLMQKRTDAHTMQSCAKSNGMRTLFENGMNKVLHGQTTIAEVLKATQFA